MRAGTQSPAGSELWAAEPSAVDGHARIRARIAGLHCSLCTGTIEKALGRLDGVGQVAVSLTHEQALVDYDPDLVAPERILSTLRDIGYELYDPRKLRPFEEEEAALVREGIRLLAAITASLAAIGLIATVSGIASVLVPASVVVVMVPLAYAILRKAGPARAVLGSLGIVAPGVTALALRAAGVVGGALAGWLAGALALAVVAGVAHHILRMAWQSARRRILNQHVLLEIGAFAGIAGGIIGLTGVFRGYPTAAFFAVSVLVANYHIFSEWLSLLVKTRSSQAVRKLLDLQPDLARVVRDGAESEVPAGQIRAGDLIRVRPGERIPVDGTVREGYSTVDLALVTGEPLPQEKASGDAVVSGALNGAGSLLVQTTVPASESFLAQVVRHVEDARALKPGILHLVDRILRVYTPAVLTISALSLAGWLAGSWAVTGTADVQRAVFAALTVLVMGYPCAVGIAAPLAIVRGAGEAADLGIIMRTGEAFQTLRTVTHVLLDKTGTLTAGRPAVQHIRPVPGVTPGELLAVAAAAESQSEHPLARAITAAAARRRLALPEVSGFLATAGFGVTAQVGGHRVLAGRPAFLAGEGIDLTAVEHEITGLEGEGHTVVAIARDNAPLGVLALADTLRPQAPGAVAELRAAGLTLVLVTGDNPRAARHIAAQAGIDEVHAQVLPEGKAALAGKLQAAGATVAMVGDGINDAPALMRADVGIAMGGGTDIATESADVILVRDDLNLVLAARDISRRSYRRVRQNVALAFTFNGVGIPLAATGLVYPVWAMAAMAASVTAIFVNSLGGRPSLLFAAIGSVGRPARPGPPPVTAASTIPGGARA
jgi:Cu+-exporting ATPase